MTDDLFPAPDGPRPGAPPRRKCYRHMYILRTIDHESMWACERCGRLRDDHVSRRSRNNRKRGVSDELTVARILGGRKVGPLGHAWDVEVEGYMRAQSKKLASWPSVNAVIAWLDAIPAGPELRAVTLADAPGGGGRVRRLIVFDLDEYARWHGRHEE